MSVTKKISVLFWARKSRTKKEANTVPLYCRVTVGGQRYDFPLNVSIRPASWIAKAQRAAGKTEADREANRVIEETGLLVTETVERIQQKHYELSIENFKLQFKAKENEYSTITKLFDYHEAVERKNLRPGSYRGYIVTRKHLLDFVRIKFHLSDYSIEAIDKAFVYEFFAYLQGYRREGTVRCAVNGALKHIARFKRIMNLAIQNEWIANNPVCLLKVHKEYVEKGYLTEEEIRRLKAVTLPPHLGIARDIFMFSVYTGMAYVDILMLTNKNITLGIDGSHWLNYHRQKTSQRVAVPLLEPAEELIARYATYHGEKAKQPIFPVPCNQAINRYLKTIAKAAGIRKDITYHCFRHTFATTITLSHGIPIETVSKMLGHASLTITQLYAKIVDKKVMDDMAQLKELYANKGKEGDNHASNQ